MGNWAFFSYARADSAAAEKLHAALDRYRAPGDLVGIDGANGPVPKTFHPVFRDVSDLSGGGHLNDKIQQALADSTCLVVLCSPAAAKSPWVNVECDTFIAQGKAARVFPVIAPDLPAAGDRDEQFEETFFPPALRGKGFLAADLRETTAASGKPVGDGEENGRMKLIAGLLGLPLDALIKREARRQRRLVGMLGAAALVFAAVTAAAVVQTFTANHERTRAVAGETLAEQNSARAARERDAAIAARAEAERNAREREEQRQLADRNAEQARIQELAATTNAREASAQRDSARNALARIFAERGWQAIARGDYPLATRYALAGWRYAPAREAEYRALLGRILHENPESRILQVGFDLFDAVVSPDGRKIVTFGQNRQAIVWDLTQEREIARLIGHESWLSSASFSPDSRMIVTSAEDDTVRLWNAATGDEIRKWESENFVGEVWFSGDGGSVFADGFWLRGEAGAHRYEIARFNVATGAPEDEMERISIFNRSPDRRRTIRRSEEARRYTELDLIDAASGTVISVLSHGEHSARQARFSPDSQRVATWGGGGQVWIWNAETGAPVATLRGHGDNIAGVSAEDREILGVAFSPDSHHIATASADRTARLWDAGSGVQVAIFPGHTSFVTEVRFTPDGQRIVTASSDGTARIWQAEPDRLVAELSGHQGQINDIAFSPDGEHILTGGADRRQALLWNVASRRETASLDDHSDDVSSVGFSPDGRFALTAGGGTVRAWDVTDAPHRVATFENIGGAIGPFVFSPDGSRLAVSVSNGLGKPVRAPLWDATNWTQIGASQSDRGQPHGVYFRGRNAYALIVAGLTMSIGGLDGKPARERIRDPDSVGFLFASISGDGTRIADDDGRIWDAETGHLLADANIFHPQAVFSADSRRVLLLPRSLLEVNEAQLYDARSGERLAVLRANAGNVNKAAFSADGARIAASFADGSLRVFDTSSGREMAVFQGSRGSANAVQFSPDGALLASGGYDRLLRLWDTRRLTQPMQSLAADSCAQILSPSTRNFSDAEIGADPLIREVWLREGQPDDRDVCQGVPGAPPLP